MSPRPQEQSLAAGEETRPAADGDRVVISGMAGLYPRARYVKDLQNILYNKINPVSSDDLRWTYDHPEVAKYTGNVPDLDRFDAQFFKVHFRQANSMDSMSRKILEQTYEAIYDAGMSPEHLSGKKVGVYIGSCFSETEKASFYVATSRTGFGISGCNKAMFANRISYWLNTKGPSLSIDDACCSSIAALEAAYKAMTSGECEAAVVGGAYLCLHPQSSVHYGRIMKISMDGKTKSFCEDAAGCARSEAINVLFLQKAKNAKRIYAELLHVKCEFTSIMMGETGPRYGFYRDPAVTAKFLKTFYKEARVSPALVEYVEGFGSAVPEVDKSELEAIEEVFCGDKTEPLLVGSVMSNIGYGEAASGISAVTKVLLGFHCGSLAGNLHCASPRRDVAALREGRMRVLADNQDFRRTYAAVNSMSVTGVNAHVLLHGYYKQKDLERYKTNIPRLVTISGRQDSAVGRVLDHLKSQPIDPEQLALLYNIHETSIAGHLGKGYTILNTNPEGKTVCLSERVEYSDGVQRPLWFVYSGMGSQWAGMGAQLMRIPIFAAAIQRCHQALEPKGLDIVHIITSPDKEIFDNILHSFVGIAAVQIGLTDILLQLGLVPDNIIGHSVGELGCAYADGCLTAEEMILAAYSRGRVSLETPFIRGSMAAVGVGASQMSSMCPAEIEIACHNSAESCTISGPAEAMRSFVADLTARGIFAKEVPCSNIAYHSRYIADAGPGLLKYLKEVIVNPRARSSRWVSSSVAQSRWEEECAKYSSAEYHTNNLLSSVLFEEASALIPADAVLVEVAPHGLLQAILKRALPDSTTNIPITRRGHTDNVLMLLDAVGKLYLHGYNPKVRVLYPDVEFPVSSGTPFLSHFVEWAHQEKWSLPLYQSASRTKAASCKFIISIHDDEYSYLKGHVIKDKTLLPFAFALVCAWDTLAMSLDVPRKSLSVQFTDVKLYKQPILHEQKTIRLSVSLHRGSGLFEILDENSKVATGFIVSKETKIEPIKNTRKDNEIETQELYQIFYERGYVYSGAFRSIHSLDEAISEAKISWGDNWVTFIDGLIQLNTLKYTNSGVSQPDRIGRLVIDVKKHLSNISHNRDSENNKLTSLVDAQLSEVQNCTRSGGVVIEHLSFCNVREMNDDGIILQALKFVPRYSSKFDVFKSLYVLIQIAAENINKGTINILGLGLATTSNISENMKKIVQIGIPNIKLQYRETSTEEAIEDAENEYLNIDIILLQNLSKNEKIKQTFLQALKHNSFIVNEEGIAEHSSTESYSIVSILNNTNTQLELAYWKPTLPMSRMSTFTIRADSDLPVLAHARNNLPSQSGLLILTSFPPISGLTKVVKKWRKEGSRNRIYVIMVDEKSKENNELDEIPDVLLANSIFDNGLWGGEYYLPLEESSAVKGDVILRNEKVGDIESLKWVPAPDQAGPGTLVAVHYAAINIGDVKRALGLSWNRDIESVNTGYGIDFSGITERGERVMGLAPNGASKTHVMAQPELMWPVPTYWSLEDAATVPFAYIYAYYCLEIKKTIRIRTKDVKIFTVLVHGGAGALGQAAISIALARGWRVFTTVSDCTKKRFLMKLFPHLNENDIGNSRDSSFGDMVLSATNGIGCNMVICCLEGELKNVSFKCCGNSSTLFDTVQIVNNENYSFGLYNLTNERSYVAVDVAGFFNDPNSKEMQKLHSLVSEGIARGEVRPLSRVTFAPDEAARAFRLLAASRHRGRALLRLADERAPPPHRGSQAVPSHVIICDSHSLGLQVAEKVIDSGIKKIHLHFISSPTGAHLRYKLRDLAIAWLHEPISISALSEPLTVLYDSRNFKLMREDEIFVAGPDVGARRNVNLKKSICTSQVWKKQNIEVVVGHGNLTETNDVSNLLHNATNLGPVEGLHIICDNPSHEAIIKTLDLASRTACPALKRFVVISKDIHYGHNTCIHRAKSGLPATLLDLTALETFQDPDGGTWHRGATVAVERALRSTEPILLALPELAPRKSLVEQIAALAEFNISYKAASTSSLEELGMPSEKSSTVHAFLRNEHHITIDEEDIPKLTIGRLNEIENNSTTTHLEEVTGLGTFFAYVDPDELLATTEMVLLPTLTNNYNMRDDEFNVNETYMSIVPGLEGHHERFRALCERLKLPAFVLQPGLDHPDEGPRQLALRYSEVLLRKTAAKGKFYLVGYETGVIVALELAAILEDHGLTGTVFCLGDGPEETRALLERALSGFTDEQALQEGVARHMFALMARGSGADVERALRGCSSWSARVDACVRLLLGHVPHSAQYARALLEAAYARTRAARRALPQPRALRSRLVVLRAQPGMCALQRTCSLQRWSRRALHVTELAAPMALAPHDPRVPAIINSYLDDDVLQAFEKRNLCDTYLINANAFMTTSK